MLAGVLVRLGVAAFSQGNEPEMGTPSQGGGGVGGVGPEIGTPVYFNILMLWGGGVKGV